MHPKAMINEIKRPCQSLEVGVNRYNAPTKD